MKLNINFEEKYSDILFLFKWKKTDDEIYEEEIKISFNNQSIIGLIKLFNFI